MTRVELLDGWADLERREVHRGGDVQSLTGREAGLLQALAEAAGRDVGRGALLQQVWGLLPDTQTRTLDATVRRLRRKVEPVPGTPQLLLTVHGVGYRWAPVAAPEQPTPEGAERVVAPLARVPDDELPLLGRDTEVAALLPLLEPGARVALVGPGGVGKSTLARELARRWSRGQARRAWWLDVEHEAAVEALLPRLLSELGVRRHGSDPRSTLQRALERLGEALIVLDGADQLPEGDLLGLLDLPGITVLCTARRRLAGWVSERVTVLGAEGAAELVRARVALHGLPAPDDASVARLVRAVDGLPLALCLLVPRLRLLSAEQLAERVARGQATHERLATWWAELPPDHQHALRRLSVVPRSFDLEVAEALLGEGGFDVVLALAEASWLQPMVDGERRVFLWLDLLRQQAAAGRGDQERDDALRQLARHLAHACRERLDPRYGPHDGADLRWLRHRADLLELAVHHGTSDEAETLWGALGFARLAAGDGPGSREAWARMRGPVRHVLEGAPPPDDGDPLLRAACVVAHVDLGKLDELSDRARLAAALDAFEEAGDARGVIEAGRVLAYAHAHHGGWDAAAVARRRGLAVTGSLYAKAKLLLVPFPLPEADQPTVAEHQAIIDAAEAAGDQELLAKAYVSGALQALGRQHVDAAVEWAEACLDTLWSIDVPGLRRGALGNCALVFREVARFRTARACLQGVLREIGLREDSLYRSHCLLIEASTWIDQGRLAEARRVLGEARAHAKRARSIERCDAWEALIDLLEGRTTVSPHALAAESSERARVALYLAASGAPAREALLAEAEAFFGPLGESEMLAIHEVRRAWGQAGTADADAVDPATFSSQVRFVRRLLGG